MNDANSISGHPPIRNLALGLVDVQEWTLILCAYGLPAERCYVLFYYQSCHHLLVAPVNKRRTDETSH